MYSRRIMSEIESCWPINDHLLYEGGGSSTLRNTIEISYIKCDFKLIIELYYPYYQNTKSHNYIPVPRMPFFLEEFLGHAIYMFVVI